jgi:hypothetical protein
MGAEADCFEILPRRMLENNWRESSLTSSYYFWSTSREIMYLSNVTWKCQQPDWWKLYREWIVNMYWPNGPPCPVKCNALWTKWKRCPPQVQGQTSYVRVTAAGRYRLIFTVGTLAAPNETS